MNGTPLFKKIVYYGFIVMALIVIAKYAFNPASEPKSIANNEASAQNAKATSPTVENADLKLLKSEITENAKFYPVKLEGINMEILAIKASDGTIRTALNTCQICYNSGRGYYQQIGDYLVCQNCGNRFNKDQVEIIKGGCNPIPIMENDKQDTGDYIVISKDYLASQINYFSNWHKV